MYGGPRSLSFQRSQCSPAWDQDVNELVHGYRPAQGILPDQDLSLTLRRASRLLRRGEVLIPCHQS